MKLAGFSWSIGAALVLGLLTMDVQAQPEAPKGVAKDLIAQTSTTDPTLPTPSEAAAERPGINYIGAGLGVGLGGQGTNPLGNSTVGAIVSKFRIVNASAFEVSFRPSVLLGTDSQFVLAGTVDFIQAGQSRVVVPFLGAGGVVGTGSNTGAFLATGGADIRINEAITAFGQVNFGFFTANSTTVNLILGAGFNF
ncbi:hypothetical protein [Candidatus Cyanaurora vandensis]|uniref:hypothetical protein n=1 Tax=Candidatus Cyanaurora vandensis TaxID=2714958 RepID=UPI00257AA664|nr:hypothetical protein [Candidatus Cyanaurora vandensis]